MHVSCFLNQPCLMLLTLLVLEMEALAKTPFLVLGNKIDRKGDSRSSVTLTANVPLDPNAVSEDQLVSIC